MSDHFVDWVSRVLVGGGGSGKLFGLVQSWHLEHMNG